MDKKRLTVLVVEDLVFAADLNVRQIEKAGYQAIYKFVSSLEELNRVLPGTTWDLIICDHSMKTLTSIDVLQLRDQFSPNTPLIVVTEAMEVEDMIQVYDNGCYQIVLKENLQDLRQIANQLFGT